MLFALKQPCKGLLTPQVFYLVFLIWVPYWQIPFFPEIHVLCVYLFKRSTINYRYVQTYTAVCTTIERLEAKI